MRDEPVKQWPFWKTALLATGLIVGGTFIFVPIQMAMSPTVAPGDANGQDWIFGRWVTVENPRVELEIDDTAINITVPGSNRNPDVFVFDRYRVLGVSDRCVRTQRLGNERTSRTSLGGRIQRTPAPNDRLTFCRQGDRQMILRHVPVDGERSEVLYRRVS